MDDNALAALKAAYGATTPGTWDIEDDETTGCCVQTSTGWNIAERIGLDDAAFIVAAHTHVPALLAEVEKLRAALEPFARQYPNWAYAGDEMDVDIDVTAGDLRRAADALNTDAP